MRRSVAAVGGVIRLSTATRLAGKKPLPHLRRCPASVSSSPPVQRTMTPAYVAWPSRDAALVISSHARSPPMKIVRPLTPLRQRMIEDRQIRNYSSHTLYSNLRAEAQSANPFRTDPDSL